MCYLKKGITYSYTPSIYAEGYIALDFPFVKFREKKTNNNNNKKKPKKTMSLDYLLSSDLP